MNMDEDLFPEGFFMFYCKAIEKVLKLITEGMGSKNTQKQC